MNEIIHIKSNVLIIFLVAIGLLHDGTYVSFISLLREKLWLRQKPLHQQKCQTGKVTTQTTPQKSSITQQLRTDIGRPLGVTTATQLVWFILLCHLSIIIFSFIFCVGDIFVLLLQEEFEIIYYFN